MKDKVGVRGPILLALGLHLVFFGLVLAVFLFELKTAPASADSLIPEFATVALGAVILLVSVTITVSQLRRRARDKAVALSNPGSYIARLSWAGVVSEPILKSRASRAGMNMRGFEVDLTANDAGLDLWYGGGSPENLGHLTWSQVKSIQVQTRPLPLKPSGAAFLRITIIDAGTDYAPELEFMDKNAAQIASDLNSRRPGLQPG